MKRPAIALVALLGGASLPSCSKGAGAPPQTTATMYHGIHWESALQPIPDILLVVRPQAVRRDPLYGPLVSRAIDAARQHTLLVTATSVLDVMEEAEEVIVGVREDRAESDGDLVVILRGVRADIDPAKMVDDSGRALWVPGPSASDTGVTELVRAQAEPVGQRAEAEPGASLFEIPGRTWVIVTGEARSLARVGFDRPATVASAQLDMPRSALAMLRLKGPSLVSRVRALRPPGLLAPLGSGLWAATIVLSSGEAAQIQATLMYKDERAVTLAHETLRESIDALFRTKPDDYEWLRSASIDASRSGFLVVTASVPGKLLKSVGRRSSEVDGPPAEPPEAIGK
ncbi:MAG: hypothetical protein WBY94_22445 [Polyangiaceae bacterium]